MGRRAPRPAAPRLSAPRAAHVVRPVGECGTARNHHAHAGSPVGMTRSPRGNVGRRCECCRCVECPRLAGLRLFSRTSSRITRWLNRAMIGTTEIYVIFRGFGVVPHCFGVGTGKGGVAGESGA